MPLACRRDPAALHCDEPRPGHALHEVQRRAVVHRTSEWRDVVVTREGSNGWADLEDAATAERVRVWHHDTLDRLGEGTALRLHQALGLLAGPAGMASVEVLSTLTPSTQPDLHRLLRWIRPCEVSPVTRGCSLTRPGHHLYVNHGMRLSERLWGWRDGVVTAVDADGWLSVEYVFERGTALLWHHADLRGRLTVGDPVEVHEEYAGLSWGSGVVTAAVASGLGAVPEPESPDLWTPGAGGLLADDVEDLS